MADTILTRERLARILALLSSDQDGEVLAAGRAAHKLLAAEGLSWHAVLTSLPVTGQLDGSGVALAAILRAQRVYHPTDKMHPLDAPRASWIDTVYALLQGRHGTPVQRHILTKIIQHYSNEGQNWRPAHYWEAKMIFDLHQKVFEPSKARSA